MDNLDPNGKTLPTRSVQIWDKQLPNVLGAFEESTFSKVHQFYIDLHEIYKLAGKDRQINETVKKKIHGIKEKGNPVSA